MSLRTPEGNFKAEDSSTARPSRHGMLLRAMAAGSCAGVTEHITMFPVDTVKTRLQVLPSPAERRPLGLRGTVKSILKHEGFFRLYRGSSLVAAGAIPAHALYFGAYESTRRLLGASRNKGHQPLHTALAGVAATIGHDLISTPIDVIKQRLQMKNSPILGILDGFKKTPPNQLFRSFLPTVMLNVPMVCTNFVTYESMKLIASDLQEEDTGLRHHFFCGGTAGAVSGFVSTPLDVVRTRIQTDCQCGARPVRCVVSKVVREEGLRALFSGGLARTIYHVPSAAITWTVYEIMKSALGWQEDLPEEYRDLI